MANPQIRAILCEDIREELNRKHSLMGVFSGNIVVPSFPANLRIAAYIELSGLPTGEHDFGGALIYAGKERLKLDAKLNIAMADEIAVVVLPSIMMGVEEEGLLEIQIAGPNRKTVTPISKKVSIGEVPSLAGAPTS